MLRRLLLAAPLALLGAGWFLFLTLPWPVLLPFRNPQRTAFMAQRVAQAAERGDTLEIRYDWRSLREISPTLRRAVIVSEDARFYDHNGIDWQALRQEVRYRGDDDFSWFDGADLKALAQSFNYYRRHRDQVRGRSTITQQLAKNLYFTEERSLLRKLGEFTVARRLEWFLSKDRILELYLNVAEWGPGVFGAEAAARHYFGRSARSLSQDQAAALAATLPHPLTSNPRFRPGRMAWRKQLILTRLGAAGPVQTVPLAPAPSDSVKVAGDSIPARDPGAAADSTNRIRPDSLPARTTPPDTARIPGQRLPGL